MVSPVVVIVLGCGCLAGAYFWWRFGRSLDQVAGAETRFARYFDWQSTRLVPLVFGVLGLLLIVLGSIRLVA